MAIPTVVVVEQAAAGGTSSTVHGCYGQWWNTAASGYCYGANGYYKLHVSCSYQFDYTGSKRHIVGTAAPFDSHQCTFGAQNASAIYSSS